MNCCAVSSVKPLVCSLRASRCSPAPLSAFSKLALQRPANKQCVAPVSAAAVTPPSDPNEYSYALSEQQRRSMLLSSVSLSRWGWISFWAQLALSITSAVILLFSVGFTSESGPRISLYMTVFGIMASFCSTFWTYGYTRLAMKLQRYADAMEGSDVQSKSIKKKDVKKTLRNGLTVNVVGMAAALLGLQAMVGMLVAKTLTSASANPFFQGTAQSNFSPVLALDVFLVQAATNTLFSHFLSLCICFLLLRSVDQ